LELYEIALFLGNACRTFDFGVKYVNSEATFPYLFFLQSRSLLRLNACGLHLKRRFVPIETILFFPFRIYHNIKAARVDVQKSGSALRGHGMVSSRKKTAEYGTVANRGDLLWTDPKHGMDYLHFRNSSSIFFSRSTNILLICFTFRLHLRMNK
jgi:hypothetical protein